MMELVKCPQCGKDVNPRSVLYPFCGGRVGDEKGLENPICPRCKIPLERKREDVVDIHACPQCNGLWLDHSLSTKVLMECCKSLLIQEN